MWLYSVSAFKKKDLPCNPPLVLAHNWGVMWQQHADFFSASTLPAFNTRYWQNWVWQLSSRPGDWPGSRDVVCEETYTPPKGLGTGKQSGRHWETQAEVRSNWPQPWISFHHIQLNGHVKKAEIRVKEGEAVWGSPALKSKRVSADSNTDPSERHLTPELGQSRLEIP